MVSGPKMAPSRHPGEGTNRAWSTRRDTDALMEKMEMLQSTTSGLVSQFGVSNLLCIFLPAIDILLDQEGKYKEVFFFLS